MRAEHSANDSPAAPPRRPRMVHALSFDVEEYFHSLNFDRTYTADDWPRLASRVEPYTYKILEALDAARYSATFFVLGWVAERHLDLIRTIARGGHEIASHGHWHRLVYRETREDFRQDVRRAKGMLEDLTGVPVNGYRAPTYSIVAESLWALDILADEGYRYDSSVFPVRHDRYGIPTAPRFPFVLPGGLVEVPLSTWMCLGLRMPVAGGGYFRLLPYEVVRTAFRSIERTGHPAVFYLHPWDLDAGQPVEPLPRPLRFRQTIGAAGAQRKLCQLLKDFRFAPLREVLDGMRVPPGTLCG
jgi:polysaccharide deacetylase family protein (PEP-CTERM system associated)